MGALHRVPKVQVARGKALHLLFQALHVETLALAVQVGRQPVPHQPPLAPRLLAVVLRHILAPQRSVRKNKRLLRQSDGIAV